MSQLRDVKRFSCLAKIFLIALLADAWTNISQVFAVNSEDDQSLFIPPQGILHWPRKEINPNEKEYRGVHAAVFSSLGGRQKMEDTFALEENIGNRSVSLYGVFDGHSGDKSSKYAAQHLINDLKDKLETIYKYTSGGVIDYVLFLTDEIQEFDNVLLAELEKEEDNSGTTALIALMVERMLYVANVGDSRAVRDDDNAPNKERATQITTDHKPLAVSIRIRITAIFKCLIVQITKLRYVRISSCTLKRTKEEARIEDEGGVIWQYPGQDVYRVGDRELLYGLDTSRALGDRYLKGINCGLIATPEIFTVNLSLSKTEFVILATDGLWDVITNTKAAEVIRTNMRHRLFGAKQLAKCVKKKLELSDNTTIMVIDTRPNPHD